MRSKRTPALHSLTQRRLAKLQLFAPLRLTDIDDDECERVERSMGACAQFVAGVQLNDSVALFLDAWGFAGQGERRYTFTVFERAGKRWRLVEGHIEEINEAVATAVRALTERALRSPEVRT